MILIFAVLIMILEKTFRGWGLWRLENDQLESQATQILPNFISEQLSNGFKQGKFKR